MILQEKKIDRWKKFMKQMKLENIKQRAPGFFELSGGYEMRVNPYKDDSANGLTKTIIDFINFSGGDANRINCQGQVRRINNKMVWTHGSTRRGTSDIHAIFKGKAISIEIKIGKDRQSDDQIKESERVRNAGGLYFIAKDMPSFLQWWYEHFKSEIYKPGM